MELSSNYSGVVLFGQWRLHMPPFDSWKKAGVIRYCFAVAAKKQEQDARQTVRSLFPKLLVSKKHSTMR